MKRMNPQSGLISIGKSRAKVYVENETGVTFDDIAGIDEARAELMEIVDFLKNPERYRRLGGKIPKGVLLVGASGTGKTLLAKAAPRRARRLRHPGRGDHPRGHQPAGDPRSALLRPGRLHRQVVGRRFSGCTGGRSRWLRISTSRSSRPGPPASWEPIWPTWSTKPRSTRRARARRRWISRTSIVAHHEAGHALVVEYREHADKASKISIHPAWGGRARVLRSSSRRRIAIR